MGLVRNRRGPMLAASMLALAGMVGVEALPAAALSPNQSIFLYKPGLAHLGVLKNGVYTKKGSLSLSGVTHAAASRSSLALYTKGTGKLRTGTFRGGAYTPVETTTIRSGFTMVAASCDTIMFYNRLTGRTLVGTLVGGRLRNRSTFILGTGLDRIAASCDWVILSDTVSDEAGTYSRTRSGILSGGDYVPVMNAQTTFLHSLMATTSTSWVSLVGNGYGQWGLISEGTRTVSGSSGGFSSWGILAGTASTILFYNHDGAECRVLYTDGVPGAQACSSTFRTGWKVITGGR